MKKLPAVILKVRTSLTGQKNQGIKVDAVVELLCHLQKQAISLNTLSIDSPAPSDLVEEDPNEFRASQIRISTEADRRKGLPASYHTSLTGSLAW